jgi:hypothetical protein
MRLSATLSHIQPEDTATWQNDLFLTIDIDWAHDEVLADTIDFLDRYNVHATWFVTHDTPLLERLRANPKYELGIHPNFNWLLSGDRRNGANAAEVIDRLMQIVPEARCVRSHSMTQSTVLLQAFANVGLTHDANHFVPVSSGVSLKPWILWNGMVRAPYCWEDDVFCIYHQRGVAVPDVAASAHLSGLRVFDFHPIHVFLNTENLDRYERTRTLHKDPEELIKHRFEGYGTRSRLLQLLEL